MPTSVKKDWETEYFYKIEGLIDFRPKENILHNVITNESVLLLSTASECLRVLIERQGDIITRQDLTENVWGKRGVIISTNTYYQTMLLLRRGLENSGLTKNIVSTHYGKGATIEKNITIIKIDESKAMLDVVDLIHESESLEATQSNDDDSYLTLNQGIAKSDSKVKTSRWAFINILLLLSFFVLFYLSSLIKRDDFFSNYEEVLPKIGKCNIYINPEHIRKEDFNKYLKSHNLTCKNEESIYLSSIYPVSRISIIRCSGNFLLEEPCESDFYLN